MTAFFGALLGTFFGWLGAATLYSWSNHRLRARELQNAELVARAILSIRRPEPTPDPKEVN